MKQSELQVTSTSANVNGYQVEISDNSVGFHFRLRHVPTGRVTHWAGYQQIVMLDGIAAATGYYTSGGENDCVPMPAADILRQFAVQDTAIKFGDEFSEVGDKLANALEGSGELLENMSDEDFTRGIQRIDLALSEAKRELTDEEFKAEAARIVDHLDRAASGAGVPELIISTQVLEKGSEVYRKTVGEGHRVPASKRPPAGSKERSQWDRTVLTLIVDMYRDGEI
ncbi:hypothetical protein Peetri_00059 [Pseudomonas phage vB_PpuM-Peetri]